MTDRWTIVSGNSDNVTVEILLGYTDDGGGTPVPGTGRTFRILVSLNGITSQAAGRLRVIDEVTKFRSQLLAKETIPAAVASSIGAWETF